MSCPSFINWLFLHLLLKPVGIFFRYIFGDMKNNRYLCNMNAKNLYSNTNWEPMLIALALIKKCPPNFRIGMTYIH